MSSDGTQGGVPDDVEAAIAEADSIAGAMEAAGIDSMYLLVQPGCEFCDAMEQDMSEEIENGVIEVLDIQESDKAIDMVTSAEETVGIPSIMAELDDGEIVTVQ